MNKSIIAALLVSALVGFSSCGGSDAPVKDTSIMPARDSVSRMPSSTMPATTPANITPINSTAQPMPAPVSAGAAGMNPEHGLPGHRCDIAVGAPLNSPPGNAPVTPQVQQAPAPAPVMTTAPASSPVPGATGKLNPPHGQPGHDCAIAVGAPLKN